VSVCRRLGDVLLEDEYYLVRGSLYCRGASKSCFQDELLNSSDYSLCASGCGVPWFFFFFLCVLFPLAGIVPPFCLVFFFYRFLPTIAIFWLVLFYDMIVDGRPGVPPFFFGDSMSRRSDFRHLRLRYLAAFPPLPRVLCNETLFPALWFRWFVLCLASFLRFLVFYLPFFWSFSFSSVNSFFGVLRFSPPHWFSF